MRSRAKISSHPIHPILVTFPIGLFITSLVFDAVAVNRNLPSLWAAAWYCILAGNIMGVAAAIPGAVDLFSVVPPRSSARSRGYKHAVLNALVLVLFISAAAYRGGPSARPDQTSFILSGIGVLCLLVSAWLGGTLVYRNQIGIDRRFANSAKWQSVTVHDWNSPVCKEEDLAPGQLLLSPQFKVREWPLAAVQMDLLPLTTAARIKGARYLTVRLSAARCSVRGMDRNSTCTPESPLQGQRKTA